MRQDAFSTPKGLISYLKFKYEIWWKWFEIDVGLLGLVSRHFHIVIRLTFFCGSPIILHFALTQAYWSSLLSSGSALFTRQWIRTSAFSSEHFHDDNNNHAHTNQTYEELETPAMQGGGSVLELVQMRIVFSMMDGRRELSLTYLSVATERVKCLISIPDFFRLNWISSNLFTILSAVAVCSWSAAAVSAPTCLVCSRTLTLLTIKIKHAKS